jgi:hypothetical protein
MSIKEHNATDKIVIKLSGKIISSVGKVDLRMAQCSGQCKFMHVFILSGNLWRAVRQGLAKLL